MPLSGAVERDVPGQCGALRAPHSVMHGAALRAEFGLFLFLLLPRVAAPSGRPGVWQNPGAGAPASSRRPSASGVVGVRLPIITPPLVDCGAGVSPAPSLRSAPHSTTERSRALFDCGAGVSPAPSLRLAPHSTTERSRVLFDCGAGVSPGVTHGSASRAELGQSDIVLPRSGRSAESAKHTSPGQAR